MKWLRIPRVIGVVACVYLVAVTIFFWHQTALRFRFVDNAQSVEGRVVALVPKPLAGAARPPGGRTPPLAPTVAYTVNGVDYTYTPDYGVMGTRVRVGDRVVVRYDAASPGTARLQGEGRLLLPLITAGFGTVAIGVAAVLVLTRSAGSGSARTRRFAGSEDEARPRTRVAD